MSEPQLRCLLCDLVLADANTAGQPTERCKQCGRDILAGQSAPAGQPIDLQMIGRKEPPPDDIPEVPVAAKGGATPPPLPLTPILEDDLPVAAVVTKPTAPRPPEPVPTVKPRPRPDAPPKFNPKPSPPKRVSMPEPPVRTDRPRPKIAVALGALGCIAVLVMACIVVIAFALLTGLKRAGKAEAPTPPAWRAQSAAAGV